MTSTAKVTVIGTGSIGTAVARALLDAGHEVAVWNRTPSRTADLVEAGAVAAPTAAEAVRSAELVLVAQLGHVVDAATSTVAEMREASYPRGPADLREHLAVVEQLERTRTGGPLGTGGLDDVRRRLERAIAAGHGGSGLTALTASSGS